MDNKILEQQYKKHIYNKNYLEKQRQKDNIPERKPGRPSKKVDPTLLQNFTNLPRGRPKKENIGKLTIVKSVSVPAVPIAKQQQVRPKTAPTALHPSLINNIPVRAPTIPSKPKGNKGSTIILNVS